MFINAGYNCLNYSCDFSFKTFFKKDLINRDIEKMSQVIDSNIATLGDVLEFNLANHIKLFRITSGLIPFCSHPDMLNIIVKHNLIGKPSAQNEFKRIKTMVKAHEMRLSVHPGQYNVLNSTNPEVVAKTVRELTFQSILLDLVGGDTIVLHIGSKSLGKEDSKKLFINNARKYLSQNILSKLAIENDDVSYNTDDIFDVVNELGIKWVYDYHHERLNPSKNVLANLSKNPPSKFHICNGMDDKLVRAHDAWVNVSTIRALEDQLAICGIDNIDLMFECKNKDLALFDAMEYCDNNWKTREVNKRMLSNY